jgi:3-phosphoinositide dependent protein kinase-1
MSKPQNTPESTQKQENKKSKEDFIFVKQIGEGSYSNVYITKLKQNGKTYATKVINKKHLITNNKTKTVKMEKYVLQQMDHPNIIRLFCTYQDKDNLCMYEHLES